MRSRGSSDAECSDLELIARLAGGDGSAFDELYARYISQSYGYALLVLDDHQAAEDVAQEVGEAVISGVCDFDPARGSLRSWIGTIANRKIVDRLRLAGRHRPEPPDGIIARIDRSCTTTLPQEPAWSDSLLLSLLRSLPPLQRRVLVLRHVADLSPAEVGATLGRSATAVRQLDSQARRAIAQRLASGDAVASKTSRSAELPIRRVAVSARVRLSPVVRARRLFA